MEPELMVTLLENNLSCWKVTTLYTSYCILLLDAVSPFGFNPGTSRACEHHRDESRKAGTRFVWFIVLLVQHLRVVFLLVRYDSRLNRCLDD